MRHEPKAVIFDMDDLLVETGPLWREAERGLLEARGHRLSQEARREIIGLRMRDIVARFKEIYALSDPVETLRQELAQRLAALVSDVQAKPGADALIDYLHRRGIPTAVASSSPYTMIEAILETRGWNAMFRHCCSAEDEAQGKPAPDVYLRAAQRLGVAPGACLALEDSPTGARAAVAAGMRCYAVSQRHDRTDFAGITTHVYPTLTDVLNTLQGDEP